MNALQINVPLQHWLAKLSFDSRTRERCWKKLARQVKYTHLPLEQCFRLLLERAKKDKNPVHHVYEHIVKSLRDGNTLGNALQGFAEPEEIMLINSGQTGGQASLAEGFAKAADLMEKKRKIKGGILKEVAYPLVLFCNVLGFLFLISTVLIPEMTRLSDPSKWTGAARLLYVISSFVTSWYGLITAILCAVLLFLIGLSLKRWSGTGRTLADKVPPWSIYRMLVGISWLYAVSILLQMKELKLVVILKNLMDDPNTSDYLRSRLGPIYRSTVRGMSLGDALDSSGTGWPDPVLVDDLRTYSTLPGFNQQLGSIAAEMLNESMEKIQIGASILGVASILFFIMVVILMTLGVFSIQQQTSQGLGLRLRKTKSIRLGLRFWKSSVRLSSAVSYLVLSPLPYPAA